MFSTYGCHLGAWSLQGSIPSHAAAGAPTSASARGSKQTRTAFGSREWRKQAKHKTKCLLKSVALTMRMFFAHPSNNFNSFGYAGIQWSLGLMQFWAPKIVQSLYHVSLPQRRLGNFTRLGVCQHNKAPFRVQSVPRCVWSYGLAWDTIADAFLLSYPPMQLVQQCL